MNKYKVYCEIDGWVEVISNAEPTVCPIDGGHTLRTGSAAIIEVDVKENPDGISTELPFVDYKSLKTNAIDRRTGELISLGYEFPPASGNIFSLSSTAQTNILALDHSKDDPALTYPISYNTIDDLNSFDVPDSATMHNMYLTALATKKGAVDSGTTLKDTVRSAVDEAGVDAVIDNR